MNILFKTEFIPTLYFKKKLLIIALNVQYILKIIKMVQVMLLQLNISILFILNALRIGLLKKIYYFQNARIVISQF